MAKFRQGLDPVQFAHPPKPRKKIRGYVASPILQFTGSHLTVLPDTDQRCKMANEFGRSDGDLHTYKRLLLPTNFMDIHVLHWLCARLPDTLEYRHPPIDECVCQREIWLVRDMGK